VGRAFAVELLERHGGQGELLLWSRSPASVAGARRELARPGIGRGRIRVAKSLAEAAEAEVLLACVAEEALALLVSALGALGRPRGRRAPVVLIASGFEPLAPLRRRLGPRYSLGRLHPLVPVLRPAERGRLAGQPFGIEGDARALRAAHGLVRRVGGQALLLDGRPQSAAAYHAGASLLGGGLVALFQLAEETMATAVADRRALRRALRSFAAQVLDNCARLGPARALTGPLARGAERVVAGHLEALARTRGARDAYRTLGRTMLALARARGSIDRAAERRLARLLR